VARHAAYYLELLNEVVPNLRTHQRLEAVATLDAEHPNIQAAIEYMRGQPDELRLVAAAWRYWYARAYVGLGGRLIEQALEPKRPDLPEYAEALHGCGVLRELSDDLKGAEQALNDSLALTGGKPECALAHARTLNNLALLKDKRRDNMAALENGLRALAAIREHGDAWDLAGCLNTLGRLHWHCAEIVAAEACFNEALSRFETLKDSPNIAPILFNLGCLASSSGDLPKARVAFERGLEQFREMNNPMWVAAALHNLGDTVTKQGDPAGAKRLLLEALKIRFELGEHSGIAATVEALAEIANIEGDAAFAVRLMAGAAAIREKYGTPVATGSKEAYDKAIDRYRSAMSDIDFEAAWMIGNGLTLETLVLFATEHRLTLPIS
jgi:tetratricopeptide (TPR) repeat protein